MSSPKSNETPKRWRGRIEVKSGSAIRFEDDDEATVDILADAAEWQKIDRVGGCLRAYIDAAKDLLTGQFAELRDYAPAHLRDPVDITAFCCPDGILVRFDPGQDEKGRIRVCPMPQSLSELGPALSDSVLHFCADPASYNPGQQGPTLEVGYTDPSASDFKSLLKVWPTICATTEIADQAVVSVPPHKPPCLIGITAEVELVLGGNTCADTDSSTSAVSRDREFMIRAPIRLPTGWSAIEVFPAFDERYWRLENAPVWAKTDLLAAVARKQLNIARYSAIDPNAAARREFQRLLARLSSLLDGPEEPAHQFLKQNPNLLSPAHSKCWSKLRFGDRVTDFVFREPPGEYLLVEIESPLREIFRKDGQQREELTHAFNQIIDWRLFLESNLNDARDKMGLSGISSNPASLIVIGRSASLSVENRQKLAMLQSQIPRLRILTYDDLIENAKAVASNLFGPLDFVGNNAEIFFRSAK